MLSTPPKCLSSSSSFDHCDKKILSQQKIVRSGVQGWGLASDDSQISHAQDWDQKLTSHEIQSSLLLLYFFCLFRILDLHAVMLWTFKGVVKTFQVWVESNFVQFLTIGKWGGDNFIQLIFQSHGKLSN